MPSSTRSERLDAVRAGMRERGLDALLVCGPEDIFYLTGLAHQGHFAFTAVVLGLDGPARIVIRAMERPTLAAQTPECLALTYGDDEDPAPLVVEALAQVGARQAGVEMATMALPVAVWERIRGAARFVDAGGLVERIRRV